MSEMYSFLFCLGLGIFARLLFIGTNALAKRTNILPVTFVLDALTVITVGAGFTLYVIFSGAVLAVHVCRAVFGLSFYLLADQVQAQTRKKQAR